MGNEQTGDQNKTEKPDPEKPPSNEPIGAQDYYCTETRLIGRFYVKKI